MNKDHDAIVEGTRVVKQFKSGSIIVPAVDDITFHFLRGKMIALKGASGSGKTTLLNLIGNLDKPTDGSIVVDGVNVSELRGGDEVKYRLRKVGFVFQSYYLVPNMTALENVMLPMELMGMKASSRETKSRQLLERVGINAAMQARRPTRLSGGEQQRVAIARALANDPAIILADEPTGNLDSKTGKRIVDLLYNLTYEGRTVIVATHSAAVAARADMVLEMEDGKVIDTSDFTGRRREVREETDKEGSEEVADEGEDAGEVEDDEAEKADGEVLGERRQRRSGRPRPGKR